MRKLFRSPDCSEKVGLEQTWHSMINPRVNQPDDGSRALSERSENPLVGQEGAVTDHLPAYSETPTSVSTQSSRKLPDGLNCSESTLPGLHAARLLNTVNRFSRHSRLCLQYAAGTQAGFRIIFAESR